MTNMKFEEVLAEWIRIASTGEYDARYGNSQCCLQQGVDWYCCRRIKHPCTDMVTFCKYHNIDVNRLYDTMMNKLPLFRGI